MPRGPKGEKLPADVIGNDGSGGLKVSGPFGTMFTADISSDRDAGLGGWSDAEIARAVRSGVSRDGRLLFWQGMPWDHFSNLDEEDVISLVAYLRLLPPVAARVPSYRPPAEETARSIHSGRDATSLRAAGDVGPGEARNHPRLQMLLCGPPNWGPSGAREIDGKVAVVSRSGECRSAPLALVEAPVHASSHSVTKLRIGR
jgi:hypothetical protein